MRRRPGTLMAAAGAMAIVLVAGTIVASPARAGEPTVVVRPGDTLGAIAARYRTSIERLVALNQLADPDRIQVGQRLALPAVGPAIPAPRAATRTHVIRYGEHLTGIAAAFGTTIAAIVAANHLSSPDRIFAGQRLVIPGGVVTPVTPASSVAPAPMTGPYRVHTGDTLSAIAGRYHTTIDVLASLNHLADASRIFVDQVLLVPIAAPAGSDWSTRRFDPAVGLKMSSRSAVRDAIVWEAHRVGVPVPLALAVAWQESGWRQDVVSAAGAVGVMQLLPDTADWVAGAMLGEPVDIGSTSQNVRAGVRLLKHYLARYAGDQRLVLAAYYQGQRAVDEHGIYPISRPYIDSIIALEALLRP
jgi:N-acetylmuramoyl-L-alanine amidase